MPIKPLSECRSMIILSTEGRSREKTGVKEPVMRLDKLTIKGQEAIEEARKKAEELGHQMIEAEHLLYALVSDKEGIVVSALEKLGAGPAAIKAELEKE